MFTIPSHFVVSLWHCFTTTSLTESEAWTSLRGFRINPWSLFGASWTPEARSTARQLGGLKQLGRAQHGGGRVFAEANQKWCELLAVYSDFVVI